MVTYKFGLRFLSMLLAIAILNSCTFYGRRTITTQDEDANKVLSNSSKVKLSNPNKRHHLLVHIEGVTWQLISISKNGNQVTGILREPSSSINLLYQEAKEKGQYYYGVAGEELFNQIHLFVDTYLEEEVFVAGPLTFDISDLNKIEKLDLIQGISEADESLLMDATYNDRDYIIPDNINFNVTDSPISYMQYHLLIHIKGKTWILKNIETNGSQIQGILIETNESFQVVYDQVKNKENSLVKLAKNPYLNQIHIFLNNYKEYDNVVGGKLVFIEENIEKVEKVDINEGLSQIATSFLITGIIVGGVAIIIGGGYLLLLAACGCPHAYVLQGDQYVYNNTLFTGATSPKRERHDYKIMPDYYPSSSDYKLQIRNTENEIQRTNLLELIVVNHNNEDAVAMDQMGNIHLVNNQTKPIKVFDDNQNDITDLVSINDNSGHRFNNSSNGVNGLKNVYATFIKPKRATNTKLILKAKNTQWGGYVYKEFSKLFGKHYKTWVKKNYKKSNEEVNQNMKNHGITLVVSIKNNNKWEDVESVNLIGDVNYNELVVSFDASKYEGTQIEVRISSGFMFWDLDYINLDNTNPKKLSVKRLSPEKAIGNNNQDYKRSLLNDDDQYMQHLHTGESTDITFIGLENNSSTKRTLFLHSKGYYLSQETYEGKLNRKELANFKKRGELSRFSEKLFNQSGLFFAAE